MKQRVLRSFFAVVLAFVMVMGLIIPTEISAKKKAPKLNCAINDSNMLKLVKAYNSDAYHILKKQKDNGDSFASWMTYGDKLSDMVDTTVHEEYHGYIIKQGKFSWGKQEWAFYTGKGKTIYVPITKVFKTSDATKKIPKKYRTFRYDTYASTSSNLSSNLNGVYGLMNEFCAYYWGCNANNSMYEYLKDYSKGALDWNRYINSYLNNRNAYAEFYYWTLTYLEYARTKKPKVYKEIMANKNYVICFDTMQKNFEKLLKNCEKNLDKVCKKYNGKSFKASFDEKTGMVYLNGRWSGAGSNDYKTLMKQINSKDLKKVKKALNDKAKKYKK